jgi:hypothetical protein
MRTKLLQTVCIAATCILGVSSAAPIQAQGQREGIVVRGQWVLEVRNPDGTLVTRREFENDLVPDYGGLLLGRFLSRRATPGHWFVQVWSVANSAWSGGTANIGEPPMAVTDRNFPTLTLDAGYPLTLRGQATASRDGIVTHVGTFNTPCGPNVAPATCETAGVSEQFTSTELKTTGVPSVPSPLSLKKNQILQVSVTISFSSPQK